MWDVLAREFGHESNHRDDDYADFAQQLADVRLGMVANGGRCSKEDAVLLLDSVKAAPTQQQPDIWTQAQQYPIIQSLGLYKMNPQPNRGIFEFWPGQEIGTPDRPRPKEFPIGTAGLEVYDLQLGRSIFSGDIVAITLLITIQSSKIIIHRSRSH